MSEEIELPAPKIFISYSWSDSGHQDWVHDLSSRLVDDGVHVILDVWDLKEGNDKYAFMESMVTSGDIDYVLIILDQAYKEKADSRIGGVGTETLIIGPEIYGSTNQEKFIPIIAKLDELGDIPVPAYLKGRKYIDFSSASQYEERYEDLLRVIFKRPTKRRPKLGKPPRYLFDDSLLSSKTFTILKRLQNTRLLEPGKVGGVIQDYFDAYFEELISFSLDIHSPRDVITAGQLICDKIREHKPLLENTLQLFNELLKNSLLEEDVIIEFLEKIHSFSDKDKSSYAWDNDHYKFIIHQYFICIVALTIKHKKYNLTEAIFHSRYSVYSRDTGRVSLCRFDEYYLPIESVNQHVNIRHNKNFLSPVAQMLVDSVPSLFTRDLFVQSDILCHLIAELEDLRWYPVTYVYLSEDNKIPLLQKMGSSRHFNLVKGIFQVSTPAELTEKIQQYRNQRPMHSRGYSRSFHRFPMIEWHVDPSIIASYR